jgi:hypothetical protein
MCCCLHVGSTLADSSDVAAPAAAQAAAVHAGIGSIAAGPLLLLLLPVVPLPAPLLLLLLLQLPPIVPLLLTILSSMRVQHSAHRRAIPVNRRTARLCISCRLKPQPSSCSVWPGTLGTSSASGSATTEPGPPMQLLSSCAIMLLWLH